MRDIRKGNDIAVQWSLMRDGQPFSLQGLNITLYLKGVYEKIEIKDFSISENKVLWRFHGKDQKYAGKYSLVLVVNDGEVGMITTDACDFVRLVSCTCQSDGADECGVVTETIDLESTIEYVAGGEIDIDGVVQYTTILLPNDSTFASDVANEEFLAHNRETYAKLYAQADKELSVSMRYFGHNILCNPTMRVRFVDDGVNPYYDYCYVLLNGNLIETGQAYRLYSDGKVAKVKFNGDIIIDANGKLNEDIAAEILYGEEVLDEDVIRSNYTQSRESSSAALGTKWQPCIALVIGTDLLIANLFGSNDDEELSSVFTYATWDKETNIVTALGGWTHPLFGSIDNDIQFNFDPIAQTLTTVEETITLAGWATITGYKITRTNPFYFREDNLTEYLKDIQDSVADIQDSIAIKPSKGNYSAIQDTDKTTFTDTNTMSSTVNQKIPIEASGAYSLALGEDSNASGKRALAHGHYSIARGTASHAEGQCCVVDNLDDTYNGYGAHAEGYMTYAIGPYSHAEGSQTCVRGANSHAEGYQTITEADNAHAEGYLTEATHPCSHAEGNGSRSTNDYAHAEGFHTDAHGMASHTEGQGSITIGDYSHAEGGNGPNETKYYFLLRPETGIGNNYRLLTLDVYEQPNEEAYNKLNIGDTIYFNDDTYTITAKSTSDPSYIITLDKALPGMFGGGAYKKIIEYTNPTTAKGFASHAEGAGSTTIGGYSHAEGNTTTASGKYSHSEGWVSNAIGESSHAEGQNTRAHGTVCHSEGNNTDAYGYANHTEGLGTKTHEGVQGQHAEGHFNYVGDGVLLVGCGTADEDRKNAIEVKQDGAIYIKGIGGYEGTTTDGKQALNEYLANKVDAAYVNNAIASAITNVLNEEV